MVAVAKAAGCRVELLTNGTLLKAHLADEFIKAGLDELRVSLWAANEEEYRSLYPETKPEMFHRTVAGVQSVVAAKQARRSPRPRIILHRPIDSRFFRQLEGTLDLARQTGCDAVSFSPLKPLLPQDQDRMLTAAEERELALILANVGRKAQAAGLAYNTALPFLLLLAIGARVAQSRQFFREFLSCLPLLFAGLCARAWGEFLGVVITGRDRNRQGG